MRKCWELKGSFLHPRTLKYELDEHDSPHPSALTPVTSQPSALPVLRFAAAVCCSLFLHRSAVTAHGSTAPEETEKKKSLTKF